MSIYWNLIGNNIKISRGGLTVRQVRDSQSAVANKIFKPNTGEYFWFIMVDSVAMKSGCKGIGIVNAKNMEVNRFKLNENIQYGLPSSTLCWNGSSNKVQNTIDGKFYEEEVLSERYKTGDIVTVNLDMNKKCISFSLNDEEISINKRKSRLVLKWKGDYEVRPIVGFGRDDNREQYTIC